MEATTDEPEWSSAALCIELRLLDQTFRPEYTHQCFPGERIRGYQPLRSVLPTDLYHTSYAQHDQALRELAVRVTLAPSCQTCVVEVETAAKRMLRRNSQRTPTKRHRTADQQVALNTEEGNNSDEDDPSVDASVENSTEATEEETSEYEEGDDSAAVVDPNEGSTRQRRMPVADIRQQLSLALPVLTETRDLQHCANAFLRRPLGTIVESYTRKGMEFVVTLADGRTPSVAEFHHNAQRLALFFIENADGVDVASVEEGHWKVLYVFRKHSTTKQYSLVAYTTLFHFSSPFRKPTPGIIVRVCQVLVLPPYQRQGHGRDMLQAVYRYAHGQYEEFPSHGESQREYQIVQVNVEDPAPAFTALRNRVDYQHVKLPEAFRAMDVTQTDFFGSLPEPQALAIAEDAKVTVRQVHTVYEIDRWQRLQAFTASAQDNDAPPAETARRDALEKAYRLLVKRRLNKLHREELSAFRVKTEMQDALAKLYDEQVQGYQAILESLEASQTKERKIKS